MTILCTLLVLRVAILFTRITNLYDLTKQLFIGFQARRDVNCSPPSGPKELLLGSLLKVNPNNNHPPPQDMLIVFKTLVCYSI